MKKKFKENNCLFSEQWHLVSDFCPTTEEDVTFVTDDGKLHVGRYNEGTCEFSYFEGTTVPIEEVHQWKYLPLREVFGFPQDGETVIVNIAGVNGLALGMFTDRYTDAHGDRRVAVLLCDDYKNIEGVSATDEEVAIAWEGIHYWYRAPEIEPIREPNKEIGRLEKDFCPSCEECDECEDCEECEEEPVEVTAVVVEEPKAEESTLDDIPPTGTELTDAMVDLTNDVKDSVATEGAKSPVASTPKSQIAQSNEQDDEEESLQVRESANVHGYDFQRAATLFFKKNGYRVLDEFDADKGYVVTINNRLTKPVRFNENLEAFAESKNVSVTRLEDDDTTYVFTEKNTTRKLNEDYGWEIKSDYAFDAFYYIEEAIGTEELVDALVKAMDSDELYDFIMSELRDYDFEDDFDIEDSKSSKHELMDILDELRSYLGDDDSTISEDLARYLGNYKLADYLAFICRNYDIEDCPYLL